MTLESAFRSGLEQLQLSHIDNISPYLAYIEHLKKWNRAYNLTAVQDEFDMLYQHVLESLALLKYVEGVQCLDVGSGAGLPGLILAMADADKHWTLVDSNIKKTRFMQQLVMELALTNVSVLHTRIEDLSANKDFDTITSRAFTELNRFYQLCWPMTSESGQLLAMKAGYPESEHLALLEIHKCVRFVETHLPPDGRTSGIFIIRREV